MPTIDDLPAATAAADTDALMVSQTNSARKVTRAQLLAGLQPAIVVPAGDLLGNGGSTSAGPLPITVGSNLVLAGGTLSATAAPFIISALPVGAAPGSADLVAVSQSGTINAVSYASFANGLAALPAFDTSPLKAKAIGGSISRTLGALFSDVLTIEDFGAVGDGVTDDTAAFLAAVAAGRPLRLGAKTYVINGPVALTNSAFITILGVPGQTTVRRLAQTSGATWISITAPVVHADGVVFDANISLSGAVNAVGIAPSCLRSTFLRCAFINAKGGSGLLYDQSDPVQARHSIVACEAYGNVRGIYCAAADGLIISACHVHDNSVAGITVDYVDPAYVIKSRLAEIIGNECWNNLVGIQVGDYTTANAVPATIANTTSDAVICLIGSNICHDNAEYGIAAQGYNLLVQSNIVYNNGGTNLNNGGILVNMYSSAVIGNLVTNHLGFGIDAGAANFTQISGNVVTNSRIAINAGGAQEARVIGNAVANASTYGICIYNNETTGGGAPIGVPSLDVSIIDNTIDMPTGGTGIALLDGPQGVQVARNNFITPAANLSMCLLALTDSVLIEGNLLNGSPSLHLYDPGTTTSGQFSGLYSFNYPDILDNVSIMASAAPIQSIRSVNAANYGPYVTFLKLTAGGSGYSAAPTITFSGGGGSGATATAYITNGVVIGYRMASLGSGYTSAPTAIISGGGGSGAAATAFIGIPVPPNRKLRIFCGVPVTWANAGSNPRQLTGSGTLISTPANSDIEWVGLNGGWYASRYEQSDYVLGASDGSVTLRSIAGNLRLHPAGSGVVQWANDSQATGCTTTIGSGLPNGVVSAPVGSDYRNLSGVAGNVYWIKQSGTGSSGWAAIA
jgi:hypothetical protein